MNSIYLIKIFNLIGLMYVPLNFVFGLMGYNNTNGLIYVWLCFIGFSINHFLREKSKLLFLSVIILFLPLITAKSISTLVFLLIYCCLTIVLVVRSMSNVRYEIELYMFKKGIFFCLGTCIVSIFFGAVDIFTSFSAYYVIIYLVSSILLLRNLRLAQYTEYSKKARRINNRYSIFIVIVSFILSVDYVRETVVRIIKNVYLYISQLFLYLFSWLIVGISNGIFIILKALIGKAGRNTQKIDVNVENNILDSILIEEGEPLLSKLINNTLFKNIVNAFLIFLVVYIIVRLLRGYGKKEIKNEEYSEEKEFILRSKEGDKRLKNRILNLIKPRSNEDKIRQYYQKYMIKCLDENIEIKAADTTEEIRNKSLKIFDKTIINSMRNIYIKIRYGEEKISRETVKEMARYYANTKKQ